MAVRREQLEPAVESTENFDTSMAQPTDGTLDEAMAQPTDVTFQELRELNLVGARGGAPNDIVMRLANDIANKVQSRQMANTSVRQLADQLGLTPNQGGFRQRAKKLSGAILTYRQLLEGVEAVQHGELQLHEGLSVDAEPDSTPGSGPSSAFDILVTDAEAPGRVLVGEPSLTPHSSAFDEAVAKEIAENGEEVDITEKLNRLALATSAPSWLPPGSQAMTQAELEQAWGQYCSLNYSLALTRDKSRKERGPSFDLDGRVMDAKLLEAVNELKSEGNSMFGRKSYRAASRCYTEAIDQIRICRVREQAMSSSIKLALSTKRRGG